MVVAGSWPQPQISLADTVVLPTDLRTSYAGVVHKVRVFEDRQVRMHSQIVAHTQLADMLSEVQLDSANADFPAAKHDVEVLSQAIDNWNLELSGGTVLAAEDEVGNFFLPILLYHYTPTNFDEQLTYLEQHGYTVIDMSEAVAGLHGGPLPPKPVVITFDDGFADQMNAFEILRRHNMKATFYIINGGEASRWCIGAGRRYGDPLQPPGGCGDAYLSWDQVRELDRSGLITIGGHTLDHENLAGLSEDEQRQEIFDSKAGIEQQLGHPIHDFAYPYGAYDYTSVELVREAGYDTAVSTLPGQFQALDFQYTLRRERDALALP
jgi:peptidoglycan/xylan/chitin deacetylase (PgdA/CDA1 family)